LEDEEKLILALLQTNENKMDLGVLKIKSELSGKKWDAAMKGLAKHGLVKVSLVGESKIVEIVG
jgi:lysyl-tRNA synthetase class 2